MSAMLEPDRPLLSDAELLQRLARRDSTALIEVERRHWSSLYAQVYGMVVESDVAERVVREVFTQLWFAAERFPLKRSLWTWLRDMARELSRAELALAGPNTREDASIRRLHEASTPVHPDAAAAGTDLGADAGDELPGGRYRQGEKVDGDGPPRDACAW
jgi:DNA-directed RNA polymerase specialized sigma24 family protein